MTMRACFTKFPAVLWVTSAALAVAQPSEELKNAFSAEQFSGEQGDVLLYRQMTPAGGEDANQDGEQSPLLVFLHGYGERGDDNTRQLIHLDPLAKPEFQRYGAYVVVPQCPDDEGVTWTAKLSPKDSVTQSDQPTEPMQLVIELVNELVEKLPIDPDRVYVAGLSMGGYATWDLVMRRPEQFAAAAPICSGADLSKIDRITHLPIWVFHGAADNVVPVEHSRKAVAALRDAGATPIYTEYEGVGHNSWTPALENRLFWDWLFAQRRTAEGRD